MLAGGAPEERFREGRKARGGQQWSLSSGPVPRGQPACGAMTSKGRSAPAWVSARVEAYGTTFESVAAGGAGRFPTCLATTVTTGGDGDPPGNWRVAVAVTIADSRSSNVMRGRRAERSHRLREKSKPLKGESPGALPA
jgi:hypothetical protein